MSRESLRGPVVDRAATLVYFGSRIDTTHYAIPSFVTAMPTETLQVGGFHSRLLRKVGVMESPAYTYSSSIKALRYCYGVAFVAEM
jgi:hypothetical protein